MSTTSENLQLWSTTAADNASADQGINWPEGQDPSSINNSARAMMATLRKYVKDTDGALTAGGSANALTVTTGQGLANSHLADGLRIGVWAANANTSATVTIAVDGLTAKTIKDAQGNALAVGAITAGMFLDLAYEAGAGVFCAVNINPSAYTDLTVTNDILLSSGSIINFDSGDVTLTHSADTLTMAGGSLVLETPLARASGGTGSNTQGSLDAILPVTAFAIDVSDALLIRDGTDGLVKRSKTITNVFDAWQASLTDLGEEPLQGYDVLVRSQSTGTMYWIDATAF